MPTHSTTARGSADGRLWQEPFEATLGALVAARTGLHLGDEFVGSHGLAAGGPQHGEHPYTVVGVLEPTASVLDRVVLTPIESVWLVHGMEPHEHDDEVSQDEHARAMTWQRSTRASTATSLRLGAVGA